MSTPKSTRKNYLRQLLTMPRRESRNWEPRTEVVVCETHQMARDSFRIDALHNIGRSVTTNNVELIMQLDNGTVRRYFSAQQGAERVMGMEVHEYFNLIRDPKRYWEWENVLLIRKERYNPDLPSYLENLPEPATGWRRLWLRLQVWYYDRT